MSANDQQSDASTSNQQSDTSMIANIFKTASLPQSIDEVTDVVSVLSIAAMVLAGYTPSQYIIAGIVGISLGKRVIQGIASSGGSA